MSVFLGIDIGTSGTKTLAIDPEGRILASALETTPFTTPNRCGASRSPTIGGRPPSPPSAAWSRRPGSPADVKAIGLSGQMHGSVFLDKQCKVVRRAILWNDQRTAAECEEIDDAPAAARH